MVNDRLNEFNEGARQEAERFATQKVAVVMLSKYYDQLREELCPRCRGGVCSAHRPSAALLKHIEEVVAHAAKQVERELRG